MGVELVGGLKNRMVFDEDLRCEKLATGVKGSVVVITVFRLYI